MIDCACILIKTVHVIGTVDGATRRDIGGQVGSANGRCMTPIAEIVLAWIIVFTHVV